MSAPGRSPKRTAIILISIAAGLVVAGWMTGAKTNSAPQKSGGPPPVPVSVEHARTEDVPEVARTMGKVQSLHEVVVRTQVAGVLVQVAFKEGQMVKKGDLLARVDDRMYAADLASARAEKKKTEAQLAAAKIDLGRYQNLFAQGAMAKQAVDQQAVLVEQLESTVAANDAAIAVSEARLSYTRILSPVDGRVGLRRVDAGNVVQPNDPNGIVNVAQLDPITVVFALSQDLLPVLRPLVGSTAAPIVARDRPSGVVLGEGRLAVIDNQVDRTTGTVQIKGELSNAEEKLWPGQTVSVELQTGFTPNATVVSARAIQRGPKGPFVYVLRDDKAEVVPVKLGYESSDRVVVAEGLKTGDVVVNDGHSRLVPGGRVKIVDRDNKASAPVAKESPR